MELGWYPTPAVGRTAGTIRCLNVVDQMTASDEGRRNMESLDNNSDNMASRDVIQWSSSLMQEFKANFTAKVT